MMRRTLAVTLLAACCALLASCGRDAAQDAPHGRDPDGGPITRPNEDGTY